MKLLLFLLNFKISPCNHGVPLWKRLRNTVGGNQQLYVPIPPKPVAAVVPAPSTPLPSTSTSTGTAVATPTNYQLSASRNLETESRTLLSNLPVLDLSSSLISVAQAASTPASQNSGSMVTQTPLLSRAAGTILPFSRVNLLEKSTVQGPSSISGVATRPEARSSDNAVAQSQLAVSSIVSQSAPSPSIHHSVSTSSLSLPSQRINSSLNMVPSQQLRLPVTASTTPVSGSFNMLSQRQLVTLASNSLPNQPLDSSVDMVPQVQLPTLATVSQTAPTLPVNYGTLLQGQLPTLATNHLPAPSQAFGSSVNTVPQGQSSASSTVFQVARTPPVNGSFNTLLQGPFNNSVNMEQQGQLRTFAAVSQSVSRQVQPFVSGNITPESQISRSAEVPEQELEGPETGSQVTNEAIRRLHGSNIATSAVASHASNRIMPSPGLSLLADVVGEAQLEQWENSIPSSANIQVIGLYDVRYHVVKLFSLNNFSLMAFIDDKNSKTEKRLIYLNLFCTVSYMICIIFLYRKTWNQNKKNVSLIICLSFF